MRVLWIGKPPAAGDAGDEVFDRKTIAALRTLGHEVDILFPSRVTRLRELANLALLVPYYRTRYASKRNYEIANARPTNYDFSVCSWEPLDILARHLPKPVIVIAHNVTSLALPQLFPNNRLVKLGAYRAGIWEKAAYRAEHLHAVATLSRKDFDYVSKIDGVARPVLMIPGMPPVSPLASEAPLLRELVLTGTYDWVPKHRDVALFFQELAALPNPPLVYTHAITPGLAAERGITVRPIEQDPGAALRFGVITDRFEAGHKLKTLAYIAENQIVLSYTDVTRDFADIADATFFLRRITAASEIDGHVAALQALDPDQLRARFLAFQRRCAQTYTWEAAAARLVAAAVQSAEPAMRAEE